MKKILSLFVIVLVGCAVVRANEINWASTVAINDSDGVALSHTSAGDGVTALVQLVYAGADNQANEADYTVLNGVTGDDVVVGYAWIGLDVPPLPARVGTFSAKYNNSYVDGSQFFIRAWEGASAQVGTGYVPDVSNAGKFFYGNSSLFTVAYHSSGNTETFNNTTSFNTSIEAIPEPAVASFIAIFGAGIIFTKRIFGKA